MTLFLRDLGFLGRVGTSSGGLDPDAAAYISAVESEDEQALELSYKEAVDDLVTSLKGTGEWNDIYQILLLCGARSLSGALVPLKGPVPTQSNLVSGDYNRSIGIKGNGSTKYVNTNALITTAGSTNDHHISAWKTLSSTTSFGPNFCARSNSATGSVQYTDNAGNNEDQFTSGYINSNSQGTFSPITTGFMALSRGSSSSFQYRQNGSESTKSFSMPTALNATNAIVLARSIGLSGEAYSNGRIAVTTTGTATNLGNLYTYLNTFMAVVGGLT